jgi:hypothetical protein
MEREHSFTNVFVPEPLIQRQTEVIELVKSVFESLGNSEDQLAIDTFNRVAVQDVGDTMAAFEV